MLGSLFIGHTVTAIEEALASAKIDGVVGIVEQLKVGTALAGKGLDVVLFSSNEKALKKHGDTGVLGSRDSLPVDDASLDAVVGFELGAVDEDQWEATLAEWSRVTRDGGLLVLVDRASPTEMTRRALCGGLAEIQQRAAGRTTVTSGLVTRI